MSVQKRALGLLRSTGIVLVGALLFRIAAFLLATASPQTKSRLLSATRVVDEVDNLIGQTQLGIIESRDRMIAALLAGDIETYLSFFSNESVSQDARGTLIAGRQRLRNELQRVLANARYGHIDLNRREVSSVGSIVLESGHYEFVIETAGGSIHLAGRFTAVWKRERDRWKIAREAVRAEHSLRHC